MEDLQNFVLECFSEVPNNKLPADDFEIYKNRVYNTDEFPRIYYIKPQKDICQVCIHFTFVNLKNS